ncbi:leucine-rich repeat-containing protein 74B [Scleropages formosus]|uniref:leucine-rich repeat-containing protein 74B n=1 Tax=Scleropages formosus TaxID=113540 RepID=UPI000878B29D|nr:leucine-rich repeat-containing protein 74B-like [Scleropages formosus]
MVIGKKLVKEPLLPFVLEDSCTEMEDELFGGSDRVGGIECRPLSRPRKEHSRGSVDHQMVLRHNVSAHFSSTGPRSQHAHVAEAGAGMGPDKVVHAELDPGMDPDRDDTASDEDYDTDLELEDVQKSYDPSGQECYKSACKGFGVVPVSYFLRHMHASELTMMHHGLGPQGTRALAVPLVTNTSILKLNLRDNWMEGTGGVAMAEMLRENCYITDIDLSENQLGDAGADAISNMLLENTVLVCLSLSANNIGDSASKSLAKALTSNQKLQVLDLSLNRLGNMAGKLLGNAIAENTGLRTFNLSWNCIRGKGAITLAKGLGANIFLRMLDLSCNGLALDGAIALGEALRANNTVEKLNISNNRIPPEGAIRFAMGLKVNKTIMTLNMSRNPIQTAGCYGVLKALQNNPDSAMESLDFSHITVDQDFVDLYSTVKDIFPVLQVKHGGITGK